MILSQTIAPADWGVADPALIRFGRVAVVSAAEGQRLNVRRLSPTAPPVQPLGTHSATPAFAGNNLIVADFAQSNRTALGGYFSTFSRAPSHGTATVQGTSDGRRALTLTCQRQEAGFCGLWIQLYDFDRPPAERRYLDARPFSTLSFWIRGGKGGERVLLKLADAEWERSEDALALGEVAAFLPTGRIDTAWQQAVIPMTRLPARINPGSLALLVFEALTTPPGTSTVHLGPAAFSIAPGRLPSLPEPQPASEPTAVAHKATWVWTTRDLLADSAHSTRLIEFLSGQGIDRVFLQLPGVPDRQSLPGELAVDAAAMAPLIARFTSHGIKVYALDGFARYALPEYHAGVLKTIDHVVQYNRTVGAGERFIGVRYDIEPYILPAFHGPGRDSLIHGLLDITARSAERARAGNLLYGADIPFWYDAPNDVTGEPVTAVYRGARKLLSEHVIELVDDVSIMDYRTTGYGADGTIRHAGAELAYAAGQNKTVFIGLETFDLPDEELFEFRGEPNRGLPAIRPARSMIVFSAAGDSARVFYVGEPTEADTADFAAVGEWFTGRGMSFKHLLWWPVTRRVEVPAAKITFARHDARRLRSVMEETARAFGSSPAFGGFAIHSAESYRALVDKRSHPPAR